MLTWSSLYANCTATGAMNSAPHSLVWSMAQGQVLREIFPRLAPSMYESTRCIGACFPARVTTGLVIQRILQPPRQSRPSLWQRSSSSATKTAFHTQMLPHSTAVARVLVYTFERCPVRIDRPKPNGNGSDPPSLPPNLSALDSSPPSSRRKPCRMARRPQRLGSTP